MGDQHPMTRPRLFINRDQELDWLIALEYGRVDDGQPEDNWRIVDDQVGFLHDGPGGPPLGFMVPRFSEFDVDAPEVAEIWEAPHFDVPLLGLDDVPPGEIVLATRALLGGQPTVNRRFFDAATRRQGNEAMSLWLACLEAGDSMAHFGLGYTLFELGRHREAYRHLRHYVQISPAHPWNWCWLGKAAEAIGEIEEARDAFERAIELTEDGAEETDAPELLEALGAHDGGR